MIIKGKTLRLAAALVALVATGAAAVATTASALAPLTPASGSVTITPASGLGSTAFGLSNAAASCTGDSASGNYFWTAYFVSAGVDSSQLTFDGAGSPVLPAGAPAGSYASALSSAGTSLGNSTTGAAVTAGGPGAILIAGKSIDPLNVNLFPQPAASGLFHVGLACYKAGVMDKFYETTVNVTVTAGVVTAYAPFVTPNAPTVSALTSGNGTLSGTITAPTPAATPAVSSYTITATPAAGSGGVVPAVQTPATAGAFTFTGLTNGVLYTVTATATNGAGTSVASAPQTGTPADLNQRPPVTNPTFLLGPSQVTVGWTVPALPPTGYTIVVTPAAGTTVGTVTVTGATASVVISGLAGGTAYSVSVTPTYTAPLFAPAVVVSFAAQGNALIMQDVFVTRPAGALVLTQRCSVAAAMGAETVKGFGTISADLDTPGLDPVRHIPLGLTTANGVDTASGAGTAPTGSATTNTNVSGIGAPALAAGTPTDPVFGQYPYPVNANGEAAATYPTHCGVNLGIGKLITGGPLAGDYFTAVGRLNQVTVVDTRDSNSGWTLSGVASPFVGPSDTFSSDYLGWTTQVTDTSAATLAGYKQVVTAPASLNPSTVLTTAGVDKITAPAAGANVGLAASRTAASAAAGSGLGIATIDARIKLLIPLTAKNGVYTSTLTFSVV